MTALPTLLSARLRHNAAPIARLATALLTAALLASTPVLAADDGKAQLRAVQQRLRLADQEKAKLAADLATAEAAARDGAEQLKQSRLEAVTSRRRLATLTTELTTEKAALQAATERNDAEQARLSAQLSSTAQQLSDSNTALAALRAQLSRGDEMQAQVTAQLTERERALAECGTRNEAMALVGLSLANELERKGPADAWAKEPFTQLARVGFDNRVERARIELQVQRLTPPAPRPLGR
jgi:chromosome segregation ATPase